MSPGKKVVLITGVAGNLGQRLVRQLQDFELIGVDLKPPAEASEYRFESIDLEREPSCRQLAGLLRDTGATALVHLAFVIDPVGANVLQTDRMWQINVAGTARVMEAIAEVNRSGGAVRKFIFPSSVSAYGSDLERPATEETPLAAHTLACAVHKKESDEVVQFRATSLGACSTYLLRPHICTGASMENYIVGVLRGTPSGRGRLAARLRRKGVRLPLVVPRGEAYLHKRFQFVHVDDVARLMAWILRRPEEEDPKLTILNVAGRGEPIELQRCVELANQKMVRLPGRAACTLALRLFWKLGISAVPPEALPYMIGNYIMDLSRLRAFLGSDYERVIQYTVEEALKDSFAPASLREAAVPVARS
ncbi:MAG: NAD-dependent epimerase/dehydratase family protein [Terriglobales bacterium]